MSKKVKVALIGLLGAIISAVISVPITSVVIGNKMNHNENNNSLVVNVDGGIQTITSEEYIDLAKENGKVLSDYEALKSENDKLREQYDNLLEKYNELSDISQNDNNDKPLTNDIKDKKESVPLKDLFVIDSIAYDVIEGMQDSYGNNHGIVYKFDASLKAYAEFNLENNYETFSCNIITSSETNRDANMKIIVMTEDGTEIGTVDNINKHEEFYSLGPIDISGKKKLIIKSFNTGGYDNGFCYLTDAVLK